VAISNLGLTIHFAVGRADPICLFFCFTEKAARYSSPDSGEEEPILLSSAGEFCLVEFL